MERGDARSNCHRGRGPAQSNRPRGKRHAQSNRLMVGREGQSNRPRGKRHAQSDSMSVDERNVCSSASRPPARSLVRGRQHSGLPPWRGKAQLLRGACAAPSVRHRPKAPHVCPNVSRQSTHAKRIERATLPPRGSGCRAGLPNPTFTPLRMRPAPWLSAFRTRA